MIFLRGGSAAALRRIKAGATKSTQTTRIVSPPSEPTMERRSFLSLLALIAAGGGLSSARATSYPPVEVYKGAR